MRGLVIVFSSTGKFGIEAPIHIGLYMKASTIKERVHKSVYNDSICLAMVLFIFKSCVV